MTTTDPQHHSATSYDYGKRRWSCDRCGREIHPGQYSKVDGRRVCERCVSAERSLRRALQRLAEHNALYDPPFTLAEAVGCTPDELLTSTDEDEGRGCVGWGGPCGRQPEYLVNDTPCCKAHLRQQVGIELARRDDAGLTAAVLVTSAGVAGVRR